MMVGHTHDDIDQMFSRFNVGLRKQQDVIYRLSKFMKILTKSYTPSPSVEFFYGVRDWKSWLDLASKQAKSRKEALHGHLRPHQFKFLKGESGRAGMYWKRWARDASWFPKENVSLELLAHSLDIGLLVQKSRRWRLEAEYLAVVKMFDSCKENMTDPNWKAAAVAEMDADRLRRWQGMVASNGFVRPHDDWVDKDDMGCIMVPRKKWDQYVDAVDGDDYEGSSIFQDEVVTEDEDLIYTGPLHSVSSSAYTNKKNYVDTSLITVDEFIWLRIELVDEDDAPLCMGKVLAVDHEARTVTIHWYNDCDNSFKKKQTPLMKALSGVNRNKNDPYTDTQDFDSVVISEGIQLTKRGCIPLRIQQKAIRRVDVADIVVENLALRNLPHLHDAVEINSAAIHQ